MHPTSIRTYSALAAVPAALVVLGHLALVWGDAAGFEERRRIAFEHGIALAVVLGVALVAARIALRLERGDGWWVADAIGIAGTIAVLAHLAWVWRDGSDALERLDVTLNHAAAFALVWISVALARRSHPAPTASTVDQ